MAAAALRGEAAAAGCGVRMEAAGIGMRLRGDGYGTGKRRTKRGKEELGLHGR